MKSLTWIKHPYASLTLNLLYALGNCSVGFSTHSWWFITVGAYYAVLATTRFSVLQVKRKANGDMETELFAKRITGILLIVLSACLMGINTLSALQDRGTVFHEIIMIAIATYTFTNITLTIIRLVKAKKHPSPIVKTLRNISFADALVSIYTLQRSMLVSFAGMEPEYVRLFNILTGTAVWFLVCSMGIFMIGGRCVEMAKSKIAETNEKIAKVVTDGYTKIEKGVVGGYKKIEHGVVDGFTKLEDKFVDTFLAKDGETVEEAKARLKKEQ